MTRSPLSLAGATSQANWYGSAPAPRPVLVTDTNPQSRSALATVRALAAAGYEPTATTSGSLSLAAASRHCRRRIEVPDVTDEGYAAAVRQALERNNALTVLATSDAALLALGADVSHFIDKRRLAERAESAGLPTLPQVVCNSPADLPQAADVLGYPVVVKPVISTWGAFRADSPEDLVRPLPAGAVLAQPFITHPLRSAAGVVWNGELVASVHQRYLRTWPVPCGPSSAAETVRPDLTLDRSILALLSGYSGIFQVQFAGDRLIDVNVRPYGSLPLALAAGVNLVGIYCDLIRGEDVQPVQARAGVFYRWLDGDLRSIWTSFRSNSLSTRAAAGALMPRRASAHSVESLRDPAPMLLRARALLARKRTRTSARSPLRAAS